MKVILKKVRLAFPDIWTAKSVKGGALRYGCSLILDPNTPEGAANIKTMKAAIAQVATEKWKEKAKAVVATCQAKDEICLHDGNLKSEYDGYEGNMFVSANSKKRPVVVNSDKSPLTEADGKPYSGCYVNASIDVWAQDSTDYGKGIFASLIALQFKEDGAAFSGGEGYAETDFEDEEGNPDAASGGADDFFG